MHENDNTSEEIKRMKTAITRVYVRQRTRCKYSGTQLENPRRGSACTVVGPSAPVGDSRGTNEGRSDHENHGACVVDIAIRLRLPRQERDARHTPVTIGGKTFWSTRGATNDMNISRKEQIRDVPIECFSVEQVKRSQCDVVVPSTMP